MRLEARIARFAPIAVVVLIALSIDPNPRGPLAVAVDLWLAGHDAEAQGWERRAEDELRDLGIDPATLALGFDLSPVAHPGSRDRVLAALDRLARDDRAKALLEALWLARSGDRGAARDRLVSHPEGNRVPRWRELFAALSPPDPR